MVKENDSQTGSSKSSSIKQLDLLNFSTKRNLDRGVLCFVDLTLHILLCPMFYLLTYEVNINLTHKYDSLLKSLFLFLLILFQRILIVFVFLSASVSLGTRYNFFCSTCSPLMDPFVCRDLQTTCFHISSLFCRCDKRSHLLI